MNRTAFFLGLSGAVVMLGAAAAVAGAGGAAAALVGGAAMNGAFSLAKDLLKDRFKDWVKSPPEDLGKLFANGHLTQLIAEAIQVVLTRERDASVGLFQVQLDRLLKPVVGYWQANYPRLTDGSLEEAHAANLTEVLHRQIQDMEDFPLATVEAWEDFLRDYAGEQKVDLEDEPRRRAAERLHRELGHALYEKAKQAAETNPRAAAALQLQFQSWLLQGIAELHESVRAGFADQTRQLARLHAQLLQSEAEFRKLAEEIREFLPIVRDSKDIIQRLDQAIGQLGGVAVTIQGVWDRVERHITETHADVREIKPLIRDMHAIVSRDLAGVAPLPPLADLLTGCDPANEFVRLVDALLTREAKAQGCQLVQSRGLGLDTVGLEPM